MSTLFLEALEHLNAMVRAGRPMAAALQSTSLIYGLKAVELITAYRGQP